MNCGQVTLSLYELGSCKVFSSSCKVVLRSRPQREFRKFNLIACHSILAIKQNKCQNCSILCVAFDLNRILKVNYLTMTPKCLEFVAPNSEYCRELYPPPPLHQNQSSSGLPGLGYWTSARQWHVILEDDCNYYMGNDTASCSVAACGSGGRVDWLVTGRLLIKHFRRTAYWL